MYLCEDRREVISVHKAETLKMLECIEARIRARHSSKTFGIIGHFKRAKKKKKKKKRNKEAYSVSVLWFSEDAIEYCRHGIRVILFTLRDLYVFFFSKSSLG